MEELNKMRILAGLSESTKKSENQRDLKPIEAIDIIGKHEYLKKAFKYIIINNKSNNAPYHNLNHLLTVLKYCYDGAIKEGVDDEKELKELLLAAIFHDVGHSLGKKTDDMNVKESKRIFANFVFEEGVVVDLESVNMILDATQYPYVIESSSLDLRQSIIRDADLMQVFEYDWIKQNILGLSTELKIDFLDFIPMQKKFLESVEFTTSWGKKVKDDNWSEVMRQYKILEGACDTKLKFK